jgi:hypothetical protein
LSKVLFAPVPIAQREYCGGFHRIAGDEVVRQIGYQELLENP